MSKSAKYVTCFNYGKQEDELYHSHRSCFTDEKLYGTVFTPRQQAIIDGEFVPNLKGNEITTIIRKAESLELYDIAESVYEDYYYDYYNDYDEPDYTLEEALDILDSLTPDDLK